MKFSLFLLPALSLLTAAAPAPTTAAVAKRDSGSQLQDWLVDLNDQVKGFSTHMTQVANAVPANADESQKQAAAASVIQDIQGVIGTFHTTNDKLVAAKKVQARQNLGNLPGDVLGQLNGQPIVFARLLVTLVQELNPALESVLVTLSLTEVYVALQPLLSVELPALVTNVGNLVNGLAVALSPLLAGLGGILGPILLGLGL